MSKKFKGLDNDPNSIFRASKEVIKEYKKEINKNIQPIQIQTLTQQVPIKTDIQNLIYTKSPFKGFILLIKKINLAFENIFFHTKERFPKIGTTKGGYRRKLNNRIYADEYISSDSGESSDEDPPVPLRPSTPSNPVREENSLTIPIKDPYKSLKPEQAIPKRPTRPAPSIPTRPAPSIPSYRHTLREEQLVENEPRYSSRINSDVLHSGEAKKREINEEGVSESDEEPIYSTIKPSYRRIQRDKERVSDSDEEEDQSQDEEGEEPTQSSKLNKSSLSSFEKIAFIEQPALQSFVNLSNLLNSAIDYWETNLTPIFYKIPINDIDSFFTSPDYKLYKKNVEKFKSDDIHSLIKHQHYDFLDTIYATINDSIKELLQIIASDFKKYEAGLSTGEGSQSQPVQTIQGGFLPMMKLSTPYDNYRNSTTKYLL